MNRADVYPYELRVSWEVAMDGHYTTQLWKNFCNYLTNKLQRPADMFDVQHELVNWNGLDPAHDHIHFKTEQDLLLFVLRFE